MSRRVKLTSLQLEEEANKILSGSLKSRLLSEKHNILSDSQLATRRNREVYASCGYVDPGVASGLYRRAFPGRSIHMSCSLCYWKSIGKSCPPNCTQRSV